MTKLPTRRAVGSDSLRNDAIYFASHGPVYGYRLADTRSLFASLASYPGVWHSLQGGQSDEEPATFAAYAVGNRFGARRPGDCASAVPLRKVRRTARNLVCISSVMYCGYEAQRIPVLVGETRLITEEAEIWLECPTLRLGGPCRWTTIRCPASVWIPPPTDRPLGGVTQIIAVVGGNQYES